MINSDFSTGALVIARSILKIVDGGEEVQGPAIRADNLAEMVDGHGHNA